MLKLLLLNLFMFTCRSFQYDWARLHACMTPGVLKETVKDYIQHFPCFECREHFEKLVTRDHPYPLDYVRTTEDVRVWTWLTHNLVNVRLNKSWESFDVMLECDTVYNES